MVQREGGREGGREGLKQLMRRAHIHILYVQVSGYNVVTHILREQFHCKVIIHFTVLIVCWPVLVACSLQEVMGEDEEEEEKEEKEKKEEDKEEERKKNKERKNKQ